MLTTGRGVSLVVMAPRFSMPPNKPRDCSMAFCRSTQYAFPPPPPPPLLSLEEDGSSAGDAGITSMIVYRSVPWKACGTQISEIIGECWWGEGCHGLLDEEGLVEEEVVVAVEESRASRPSACGLEMCHVSK